MGFFAIPTFVYPMGCVALWWLINLLWRRDWRALGLFILAHFLGAALTVLLYSPVILHGGLQFLIGNQYVRGTDQIPVPLAEMPFAIWSSLRFGSPSPIAIAMILAAGASFFLWKRFFPPSLASAVWVAALLLFYPVYPPQRVWSFLVPILAISGAAGWDYFLGKTKIPRLWTHLVYGFTLAISAIWMLQSNFIYESADTGRGDGAEDAAIYLDSILDENSLVISEVIHGATIQYYWLYHGMEVRMLLRGVRPRDDFWETVAGRRVLAVVKPIRNQDEFFEQILLIPRGEVELILLQDLGLLQVYEVRP